MTELNTGMSAKGIGQIVWLYFYSSGKIGPCVVSGITYTDYGKVLYNVKIRPFVDEPDNDELLSELINIDSYFVKTETELILENL